MLDQGLQLQPEMGAERGGNADKLWPPFEQWKLRSSGRQANSTLEMEA